MSTTCHDVHVTRSAAGLLAGASELRGAIDAGDVDEDDLRHAMTLVARALGELGSAAEVIGRRSAVATAHPAGRRSSSELERRTGELVSTLRFARRNAELVCRNLRSPERP